MNNMYRAQKLFKICDRLISDEEIFPICIPSYNRPEAKLLEKLVDKGLKVILFIRRDQKNLYKKYKDCYKIVLLDNVTNIGETRAEIVNWCWKNRIGNIFMLDDDIYFTDFLYPGVTSGGKDSMRPRCTNEGTGYDINKYFFKMWQSYLKKASYKVALSAPGGKSDWWNIRNANSKILYNSSSCIQCIHINTKLLHKHRINYKSNTICGVEDYTLQYDIMVSGLYSYVIKDLVYGCPSIGSNTGGNSTVNSDDIITQYTRNIELFNNIVQPEHKNAVGTKTTKSGLPSIKFNWNYWRIKEED